jgi:hypothetical protein
MWMGSVFNAALLLNHQMSVTSVDDCNIGVQTGGDLWFKEIRLTAHTVGPVRQRSVRGQVLQVDDML